MRRVIDSIKARLSGRASSATTSDGAVDDPAAQLVYVLANPIDEAKPRCLITYLGVPTENVGEILNSVADACQLRGEYPVVVMSELRPDLIAVNMVPMEFIPTLRYLPFAPSEYEHYARRRWSLMLTKWNFLKQIELGMSFDDFIADQLGHQQALPNAADYVRASDS
ncbi:hypothetical protein SAMN04488498_101715 [Mesorhizobium albiziae]|uniref:Uncharacterized protein n=1 Tax=Neomesorhizobium albiziae TaxID=335020 RepID=A0A1I3VVR2_9HYPH|nr:hypothetical protein [Mesorhizobium albiziae]GLS29169.1 hypothetical protein GCM10007937_08760 [Mesorhizobium albiziae]SFJ98356.1 hypothetical protein SAMN04488498_101715 [Mesorhizobium albiziae]